MSHEQQFRQLSKDFSNTHLLPDDEQLGKIKCVLKQGMRVRWFYDDDRGFYEGMKMEPRNETQYTGIIVAKPDVEARGELQAADCVLIIDSYPCEKENPRCDWVSLVRLLDDVTLVEVFKHENEPGSEASKQ